MQDRILASIDRFKLPIALSFLGLVLIIGGIFTSNLNKQSPKFPKESLIEGQKMISVDVSGAVKSPGVYQLSLGSRVEESIVLAGGFSDNVNSQYVSKYLNMAQPLQDGTKVYVPFQGEAGTTSGGVVTQAGAVAGIISKININLASQAEIEALPGIGPVTATKIITNRPYQKIEELLSKKSVSKAVFEKIKDLVVVY